MGQKKKLGRPRLENGARKMLPIRCSVAQMEVWKKKAAKAGLPVGTWLKRLADEAE